jgi:hypothetical protein
MSSTIGRIVFCHRCCCLIHGVSATRRRNGDRGLLPGGAACGRGSHLDSGRCVVCDGRPVEEWLEAHRHLWSPNTVRGYAASLAQWWSFLEQRGEAGRRAEAGVPAVAGFLSWLRIGRTVEHALTAPSGVPSAETLHARLAALISFYQWQEAVHSVPVAGRLLRGRAARMPSRGLLAHLDGRRRPDPSSLVKVRRRRAGRPPLLLPQESRRSLTAAPPGTMRPGNGQATCVTGCCSRCWPRAG